MGIGLFVGMVYPEFADWLEGGTVIIPKIIVGIGVDVILRKES